MERITKEYLIEFINNNKIELNPTQSKLCVPIINRIYQKMLREIKFNSIKIVGDKIIDGHHRYIASILSKFDLESVETLSTSATEIHNWNSIILEDYDWDTEEDIARLNQQDAQYNNIEINQIIELVK